MIMKNLTPEQIKKIKATKEKIVKENQIVKK
jgi:hypothetical protein